MRIRRWIIVGALALVAPVLFAELALARDWVRVCHGRPGDCFSFSLSRSGHRITMRNNCGEELGVVPYAGGLRGSFQWPIQAIRPGGERVRENPPWMDRYTRVVCCSYRSSRRGRAVAVNPCTGSVQPIP